MDYRREVDGLRALAVLPVIFFHAGFDAFSGGFVGVDVFFIISGYLITTIVLSDLGLKRFSIAHFYERRARRILPALFTVMAACMAAAWCWLLPIDMKDFSQSLASVALFSSNILFWMRGGYFDTAAELKPLLHTWSLAVEEQFYILFPLMLAGMYRLGKKWTVAMLAAIVLMSLACAQWKTAHDPMSAFFLLPSRSWELAMGALIALHLSQADPLKLPALANQSLGLIGLALVAASVCLYSDATPSPSLYTLAPTLGAALVILFARPDTLAGKMLGSKVLVGLGLISYSTYLWHQPLFAFARHRTLDEPDAFTMTVLSVTAFALGWASWYAVERPFRQKDAFKRSTVFVGAVAGSTAFVMVGLAGHLTNGFDARPFAPHLPPNYLRQTWPSSAQAKGADGRPCPTEKAELCQINKLSGRPKILLVGDSHSLDFSSAYSAYVKQHQLDAWQMSVAGCAFIPDHFQRHHGECGQARLVLEQAVASQGFQTILFVTNMNRHVDQLKAPDIDSNVRSLMALLKDMLRSGAQVIYFTPRPYFNYPPTKAAALDRLNQLQVMQDNTHDRLAARIGDLRDLPGFRVFDQSAVLLAEGCGRLDCFKGHTAALMPLYRDRSHLTSSGAGSVFTHLIPVLDKRPLPP